MPGLTNSVESSLSEKRVVVQLILKFPAFWTTQKLISPLKRLEVLSEVTTNTRSGNSGNSLSRISWNVVPPSSWSKNHPNFAYLLGLRFGSETGSSTLLRNLLLPEYKALHSEMPLPFSKELVNCLYPELDQIIPHNHNQDI
jgi:hypothetical protein